MLIALGGAALTGCRREDAAAKPTTAAPLVARVAPAPTTYEGQYRECMDAGRQSVEAAPSTYEALGVRCATEATDRALRDVGTGLVAGRAEFLASADSAGLEQFEATQRAWESYRDGECGLVEKRLGPQQESLCLLKLSGHRATELAAYVPVAAESE